MQAKIPVVNILLAGMDEKKTAIFRMAFKMHGAVRYQVVESGNDQPELAIVDVDGPSGTAVWDEFRQTYPDLPAIFSSVSEPLFRVPYLPKPVRTENLFPLIRAVMKGEGFFDPDEANFARAKAEEERQEKRQARLARAKQDAEGNDDDDEQFVVRRFQRKEQLPTARIKLFSADVGLLGALRAACAQNKDVALVYQDKPLLIVFPSIQKILLAIAPNDLKELCEQDEEVKVTTKFIADNPEWKRKAKVSFESCLWQFAVWTCRGRLLSAIKPDTLIRLKGWPNLTRFARIPDSMRLSAFMTQTTANLHILYKILKVELIDLLNFIAATYMIGLLVPDAQMTGQGVVSGDNKVQGNGLQEDGIVVRRKYKAQSTGMLQRLMSRLAVKDNE